MDIDTAILQWVYVTILSPVLGWVGGWFHSWSRAKRRTKALIADLSGLPPEAKAKLVEFHHHGAHTLRGDPTEPAVRVLIHQRILLIGPGAGTYDAVNRYLTISSDYREVMDKWVFRDIVAMRALEKILEHEQYENHDSTHDSS